MKELVLALLQTVHGTALLFIICFSLIALAIWIIKYVVPRVSSIGKNGVKFTNANNQSIPNNVVKVIVGDEYEKFLLSKEELNVRINKELKSTQQLALTRAIQHLCLELGNVYEETEEYSLAKMGHILELYLRRDFSTILLERLDLIKNSTNFSMKSEIEINNEIQSATEDCIRSMRLKIREYILISDIKILNKLFDTASTKIKDTIDEAIKNFIKLSKDQQKEILELNKKRTEQINARINELIKKEDE